MSELSGRQGPDVAPPGNCVYGLSIFECHGDLLFLSKSQRGRESGETVDSKYSSGK